MCKGIAMWSRLPKAVAVPQTAITGSPREKGGTVPRWLIRGVEWNLKALTRAGVIRRVGPDKGGALGSDWASLRKGNDL